jgi:hypothetical protein
MVRAVLIATLAAAAVGSASPASASLPALIGPAGGVPTAPAPCQRTKDCVERIDANSVGAVALCADGLYSHSQTPSSACSHDGGVARWLTRSAAPASQPPHQANFSAADYAYFRYLQSEGVMASNPSNDAMVTAANLGHAICRALDNGDTGRQFVDYTMAADKRLSEHELRSELLGAMKNYCPWDEAVANQ